MPPTEMLNVLVPPATMTCAMEVWVAASAAPSAIVEPEGHVSPGDEIE